MTATISPVQEPSSVQAVAPAKTAPKPECVCSLALPQRRLWTRAEFERIADAGVFGPEERLELIEGEIIVKVTQNSPHTTSMNLTAEALRPILTGLYIRIQQPLNIGAASQPEPDIAFVEGSIRDYAQAHPTTAVLIVEISDSTLAYDRRTKAGLYARAGVGEYWIVNLVDRTLEVHRQPAPMSERPLGHYYRSVVQYTAEETVSPLAAPEHTVTVAALLP
jgi:Uma2 family endonuclease